jgi:hypothetical protein
MLAAIVGLGYVGGLLVAVAVGLVLWLECEREVFKDNDWPHLE